MPIRLKPKGLQLSCLMIQQDQNLLVVVDVAAAPLGRDLDHSKMLDQLPAAPKPKYHFLIFQGQR